MKNRIPLPALFLLLLPLLLAARGPSQGMTLRDVTELLTLGYTDSEIKAEVAAKGISFRLDAAAEAALRKAGAGEELLSFLKSRSAAAPLDPARVLALVKEGKNAAAVLDYIASRRRPEKIGGKTLKALVDAGAPPPILMALAGRLLTPADVEALSMMGYKAGIYERLLRIAGAVKAELDPAAALALRRAGVPRKVLLAFRTGLRPGEFKTSRGSSPSPVLKTPLPDGVFRHVGKRFLVRCPPGWILLRDIREGTVRYAFTPDREASSPDDAEAALTLTLGAPPKGSVWSEGGPERILEKMLPLFRMQQPDMAPAGPVEKTRIGGIPGASRLMEGLPKDRLVPYAARVYIAKDEGLVYMAVAAAPKDRFPKVEKVFARILEKSTFGRRHLAGRGKPLRAAEIADRYKGSVVYIEAGTGLSRGQGSGFIVSRDGYVLTNWHVVWNSDADKPHENFTVRWDDSLKRPDAKAVYIGSYHRLSSESLAGGTLGGTDVALLKIPPGDYDPVPLTPVSRVKLGDPVAALGFPVSYDVAGLSLFLTQGVVVRFNRNASGGVESLTTDAKITHGNSGGPCFDLETGGVIGLNTWGYDIGSRTASGAKADNFVGYYFVCPSDAALRRFPLVVDLALPHDVKLDFFPTFELASLFLAQGAFRAALEEADRAVEIRPRSPRASILRGFCREALAFEELASGRTERALELARLAESSFEKALLLDPGNPEALVARAALLLEMEKPGEAARFAAQALKRSPRRWDALMTAARAAYARKEHTRALALLEKAKEVSRDILPDPYVLAGEISYSKGWFEEGKKEFEKAVRIQRFNLAARMGLARYQVEKGRWDQALAELRRIKGDFPGRPEPVHRIGFCLMKQGKTDPALNAYVDAESMFKKGGIRPPEEFFLQMAELYRAKGALVGRLACLAKYLLHYGRAPGALEVHLLAASLYKDKELHALASLHARRAEALAKELKRKEKPDTAPYPVTDPALAAVSALLGKLHYPPAVVADLVRHSRLAYAFPRNPEEAARKEIRRLLEMGIPGIVIRAILESNKRFPPTGGAAPGRPTAGGPGGAGRPGGGAPPPPPPSQGPSKEARLLIGSWHARSVDPMLGLVEVTMTFRPDGKLLVRGVMGGFKIDDMASYTVSGNSITTVVERTTNPLAQGQKKTLRFQFAGPNVLKIYDPSARRWNTLKRVGTR